MIYFNESGRNKKWTNQNLKSIRRLRPPTAKHVVSTVYVDCWVFKYYTVNPCFYGKKPSKTKFPRFPAEKVRKGVSTNERRKNNMADRQEHEPNTLASWWFQIFFIFIPIWGRWTHFDKHIFQMGWNHQHPWFDPKKIPMDEPLMFTRKLTSWLPWTDFFAWAELGRMFSQDWSYIFLIKRS